MAAVILSEHGFDPSCGDFGVKVVRKESCYSNCASMEVEYYELIDTVHTSHHTVMTWDGGEVSVKEVERLLSSAHVPVHIQRVSAIDMILRCVDEIHKEGHHGLPSILAKIDSDKESVDYDEYMNDESNQYEGSVEFDALFRKLEDGASKRKDE